MTVQEGVAAKEGQMYTVSKGPSKIVAKTRRGIPHTQNIEKLEILRDQLAKKSADIEEKLDNGIMNGPKPVFHTVNGKRSSSQRTQQEPISPQHAELINFIYESWEQVCKEYEQEPIEGNSEGIVEMAFRMLYVSARLRRHHQTKSKKNATGYGAKKKPVQDDVQPQGEIYRLEKEHQNKLNGSGAGGDTALLERIKILEAKLEHMEEPQRLLEDKRTEVDKLGDLLNQRTAELEQVKHITPNKNNRFKNKAKPGTSHQMKISNTSNHFDIDDKSQDSFDDDDDNEKDPD
uniref:Uncharacterized protein n=1 Tax=Timema poppense TaxID=170557 RepID=A0A7R9CPP4_TIMPO|nr:unnamed protein product [Timema poppensis]